MPTRSHTIIDLSIVRFYETTHVDGLPLDLLIEARASKRAPLKRFGVLFAETRPLDEYPIPLLWVRSGNAQWVL